MCYQNSQYKFFLSLLDLNTANIGKDIFIIPTDDINKKYLKSADTAKKYLNFEKKKKSEY